MKIAVFEADRECGELFAPLGAAIYSEDINHSLKRPEPYEAVSIFIHSKITKEILDLLPNLRYIQTRSTGYDHIDIKECQKRASSSPTSKVTRDQPSASSHFHCF